MIPIDAAFLYETGKQVQPLHTLTAQSPLSDIVVPIFVAEWALDQLIHRSVFQLKTSRPDGEQLLQILARIRERTTKEDNKNTLDWSDHSAIVNQLARFEAVLAAEFRAGSLYLLTQKKGLDTSALIANGAVMFPDDMGIKVPAALTDAREAMKCIVYELPTAAGFHLHRANESVLRRYYEAVANGQPPPKNPNIGDYLHEMDNHKIGDSKVKAALRDLSKLHRNPLIHPDTSLGTVDEAFALYCGVFTAIEAMLKAIPNPAAALPPPS
jgi:hypothetical protein